MTTGRQRSAPLQTIDTKLTRISINRKAKLDALEKIVAAFPHVGFPDGD